MLSLKKKKSQNNYVKEFIALYKFSLYFLHIKDFTIICSAYLMRNYNDINNNNDEREYNCLHTQLKSLCVSLDQVLYRTIIIFIYLEAIN